MLLEPFSMRIRGRKAIPTPLPTWGGVLMLIPPFAHNRFVVVLPLGCIPDFGRFYGSRGGYCEEAALAKNLPHRSRENEFTDGRVYVQGQHVL
jgi:hypothetical protein